MIKTIIRLPNGTEISSGTATGNAIQSVTITESVNSATELTLGSTCANVLEAKIITSGTSTLLSAGDEITAYSENEQGQRTSVGLFIAEKPVRSSANIISLTAYDRVIKLDKDLTSWLAGLTGWPYTLYNLASMVCSECGITLKNSSIPNGTYQVQQFSAQGITGRKIMQWIGEAAGRFCRATTDGKIEFAWYESSSVKISPSGNNFYYQNGLSYEDYEVAPVEKVQIKLTQDDVGVVWPNETGDKNTYVITGNYLLTSMTEENLQPIAQTLYNSLKSVTYTPCKVKIPTGLNVKAGNTVQITDRNGKSFTTYVMTRTVSGQRETLESTGSHRRDSTSVVNNQSYEAISGKLLEIKQSIEGYSVTATDTQRQLGETNGNLQTVQTATSNLSVESDLIKASVGKLEKTVNTTTEEVLIAKSQIASLQFDQTQVQLKFETIIDDGVEKVTNTTGTFNENGLEIDKSDSPTKTQISPDGMVVYKKSAGSTQEEVLTATSDGVDATNLHAKTYLIVGGRSRFENYGNNRTGCFWIGD